MRFTFEEYTDMVYIYGEVHGNGRAAERLYAERFPNRRKPARDTFQRIFQKLRETGGFDKVQGAIGAPRLARTVEMEEEVLSLVAANPRISTRSIANTLNTSRSNVWRILKNEQLHPYHLQKVQSLNPGDYDPRLNFCGWFLQKCQEWPEFPKYVLFSDEATFTREGMWNYHNYHIWEQENPHAIHSGTFQRKFSINIWVGILNEDFIGPFLLPTNMTGNHYLTFLSEILFETIEDLPLNIRQDMWFQHDGAPPHFSRNVREYLNRTFDRKWIGRGGPVVWPPRSPDLTPIDFFVWGYIKSLVYDNMEEEIQSEEELIARLMVAFEEIRSKRGIFRRVYRNMCRRCRSCIRADGKHFEQFL